MTEIKIKKVWSHIIQNVDDDWNVWFKVNNKKIKWLHQKNILTESEYKVLIIFIIKNKNKLSRNILEDFTFTVCKNCPYYSVLDSRCRKMNRRVKYSSIQIPEWCELNGMEDIKND